MIRFEDPVVQIASVTSGTGPVSGPFTLSNFILISEKEIPLTASEVFPNVPNAAVTLDHNTLVCNSTVGCGFATFEGTYRFTVSAPGFAAKTITVSAKYATKVTTDGCLTGFKDGTKVSVTLP